MKANVGTINSIRQQKIEPHSQLRLVIRALDAELFQSTWFAHRHENAEGSDRTLHSAQQPKKCLGSSWHTPIRKLTRCPRVCHPRQESSNDTIEVVGTTLAASHFMRFQSRA